jgi:hypothetical protein
MNGSNLTISSDKVSDSDEEIDKGLVIQPQMRYKPRTDLERIYEEINKNSFGAVNKHIVDRQLKGLDLNVARKNEKLSKVNDLDDFDMIGVHNNNKNNYESVSKELHNKEEEEKLKKANKYKRKIDLNSEAKNFMKDLHNKTHFKAVSVIANKLEPFLQDNCNKVKKNKFNDKEDKIFKAILEQASNENLTDINISPIKKNNSSKSIQGKIFYYILRGKSF